MRCGRRLISFGILHKLIFGTAFSYSLNNGCVFRSSRLFSSVTVQSLNLKDVAIPSSIWHADAIHHSSAIDNLLYPPGESLKARTHAIRYHPIYNFLHTYYSYSVSNLKKYSPGFDSLLECDNSLSEVDQEYLKYNLIKRKGNSYSYELPSNLSTPDGIYGWIKLSRTRDIMVLTASRPAFYGCFGLHEWAMLYSGRKNQSIPLDRHQKHIPLRVSQSVIDNVVESSTIRCTHFDAFRFFHPDAKSLNVIHPLTRDNQIEHEQPGCVHATMDLFKYAYQLYPFVSSSLLRDCITLAIIARKIDMRASPYDVSTVEGCESPLCVESAEGRKSYMEEQERLSQLAIPIRAKLIDAYDLALSKLSTH